MGTAPSICAWAKEVQKQRLSGASREACEKAEESNECICQKEHTASSCASTISGGLSTDSNLTLDDDVARSIDQLFLDIDLDLGDACREDLLDVLTADASHSAVKRKLFAQEGDVAEDAFDSVTPASAPLANRLGLETVSQLRWDTEEATLPLEALAEAAPAGWRPLHGFAVQPELLCRGWERIEAEKLAEAVQDRFRWHEVPASWEGRSLLQRVLRSLLANEACVAAAKRDLESLMAAAQEAPCAELQKLPHFDAYSQLVDFHACAMLSQDGHPVSIHHVKCAQLERERGLAAEQAHELFRHVESYLDSLVVRSSAETGRLLAAICVFDLRGLRPWHLRALWRLVLRPAAFSSSCQRCRLFFVHVPRLLLPLFYLAAWALLLRRSWPLVTISASVPASLLAMLGVTSLPRASLGSSWPQRTERPGEFDSVGRSSL